MNDKWCPSSLTITAPSGVCRNSGLVDRLCGQEFNKRFGSLKGQTRNYACKSALIEPKVICNCEVSLPIKFTLPAST